MLKSCYAHIRIYLEVVVVVRGLDPDGSFIVFGDAYEETGAQRDEGDGGVFAVGAIIVESPVL